MGHWFEGVERYLDFDADQFAFSLLTRSRRISYETLRLRDPDLVGRVHLRFVQAAGVPLEYDLKIPCRFLWAERHAILQTGQ